MLYAGLGNQTFSNNGARGLVEYLRTGRWRQLRAALAARPFDPRPLWRRALSLSVLRALPRPLYDCIMALRHRRVIPQFSTRAGALDPHWAGADAIARAFAAEDPHYNSAFAASAMDERTFWQAGGDFDGGDVRQGLEQVHGIALRDICGYRPLVEFCLGLPTDQFLRDGQDRWLARRLAQGDVPPQIAQEKRYGFHLADYHARLVRDQARWLEQVERMEDDPDIAGLIDLPRARALLQNLPDRPSADPEEYEPVMLALPRIMAAARFVRWHKGSNN
jgi:asparagine synthase (glutamine-hydrolysing)